MTTPRDRARAAIRAAALVNDEGPDPRPASLEALLDQVTEFLRRFVVLSASEATLVALWIVATHALDAFDYMAYLHISSPLPECGKSRLLEVIEALVPKPWSTAKVSAAVLMRKVDALTPTLLLDESDAAFNGPDEYAEALRGLLNSGFARTGTASVCVGQGAALTWKDFSTFCPKAIAGIGRLPSTVESRSIPIALKRRTKLETVEKWRRRRAWAEAGPLRAALATWVGDQTAGLRDLTPPSMPPGLSDRAEDVLEPLFLLADLAGGPWPSVSREAAVALMGYEARTEAATDHSVGLELLADIKAVFIAKNWPAKIGTTDLLAALCAMDDAPWATLMKGEKLTGHKLRALLRGFGIRPPTRLRDGKDTFRGYYAAAFEDAFARYLPSEAPQAPHANDSGPETPKNEAPHEGSVALRKSEKNPIDTGPVAPVALQTPDTSAGGDDGGHSGPPPEPPDDPPTPGGDLGRGPACPDADPFTAPKRRGRLDTF